MESKTPRTDGRAGGRKEATMSDTPRSINHCDCGADKSHCFDCLFEVSCQLETELAEARAEIAVLKAALWYFGNSLGPDVAEELENALPERLSRKINLTEIENTNGEAALEAAERGDK